MAASEPGGVFIPGPRMGECKACETPTLPFRASVAGQLLRCWLLRSCHTPLARGVTLLTCPGPDSHPPPAACPESSWGSSLWFEIRSFLLPTFLPSYDGGTWSPSQASTQLIQHWPLAVTGRGQASHVPGSAPDWSQQGSCSQCHLQPEDTSVERTPWTPAATRSGAAGQPLGP